MIQSFNGLTVILDGKFSFYSYIIIKKLKMRIFDILSVSQDYANLGYVDNPTLSKLDIIKTGCQVKIILKMDFGSTASISD